MKDHEPASLDDYRYLIRHGRPAPVADAAERVAIIGDPARDVVILVQAHERIRRDAYNSRRLEVALRALQHEGEVASPPIQRPADGTGRR